MPGAGNMVKLQVFLTECGYQLDSPTSSSKVAQYLAKLYAFGVLSTEEVYALLFDNNEEINQVWRVLRGDRTVRPIREGTLTLNDLIATYDSELASRQAELLPRDGPANKIKQPKPSVPEMPLVPDPRLVTATEDNGLLIVKTSSMLMACLPFVKALGVSNNPEVGARVREHMGAENFFDLLDALKGMSSREANRYYNPSTQP